jgi:hypothetical protein
MKNLGWVGLLAVLMICVVLAAARAQEKRSTAAAKWNYKVLTQTELDKAKGLSQLGEEGWDLVAVEGELREPNRVADFKFGGSITNIRTRERTFYFKRPK